MGKSVGQLGGMASSNSRACQYIADQIQIQDLRTAGQIIARLEHPISHKQFVFRYSQASLRDDRWRMFEVTHPEIDGMTCKRTWTNESDMRITLNNYIHHGFIDITTTAEHLFSRFTDIKPPHKR